MSILSQIQTRLVAPKNQFNKFGGYKYRSQEDILEGLKPLLEEFKCSLVVTDDIVMVGERIYVKATAKLYNEEMKLIADNTAFAREPQAQKGMSDSQLTGTASSYARKYALNGLFAIDDVKDADSNEHSQKPKQDTVKKVSPAQVKMIQTIIHENGVSDDVVGKLKAHYNITSWNDLPANAVEGLLEWFRKSGYNVS